MTRFVAVCGMPGSGKSILSETARRLQWSIRTMGDVVRSEVERLGLDHSPEVTGRIAVGLRKSHGPTVIADRLASLINEDLMANRDVLVDGIRSPVEIERLTQVVGSRPLLIAVTADDSMRWQRLKERGRPEDGSIESLQARDQREIGFGLGEVIASADILWCNVDEDVETARHDAESLLISGAFHLMGEELQD
ncbi:MAG TPA: AAA family ATPase [Candidatus Poseidoniales archaeon]|nr:AAA family ATPase [Candidatus Poseidoniales archaeon]